MQTATALQTEVRKATPDQMKDIYGLAIQAIPTDLSFETAQSVIGNKSAFIVKVQGLFPDPKTLHDPIKQWEALYREEFGESPDFSGLTIPEKKEGFTRLLIVAQGLTLNRAYDACAKKFPCRLYTDDLYKDVHTNDRTPTESYAVLIRDREEADEELKNLSADDLTEKHITGITLLERILLELKYFLETGKHLDKENVTLCSGSRSRGGHVPRADWHGGEFVVHWRGRGSRRPWLRSRAVSL